MPIMPRLPVKGKKIAYAILGTPPNMRNRGKKSNLVPYSNLSDFSQNDLLFGRARIT